MVDLRFPTVHINGTSKEELLAQYISACHAMRDALGTMASIYPNGRDYPTGGINEAMEQHSNRMAKLRSVLAEVEQLADAVANMRASNPPLDIKCVGCGKAPHEIEEYIDMADAEDMTPEQYVRSEEGTFNRENGHFVCTSCYIAMGMPSSPRGWKAP